MKSDKNCSGLLWSAEVCICLLRSEEVSYGLQGSVEVC